MHRLHHIFKIRPAIECTKPSSKFEPLLPAQPRRRCCRRRRRPRRRPSARAARRDGGSAKRVGPKPTRPLVRRLRREWRLSAGLSAGAQPRLWSHFRQVRPPALAGSADSASDSGRRCETRWAARWIRQARRTEADSRGQPRTAARVGVRADAAPPPRPAAAGPGAYDSDGVTHRDTWRAGGTVFAPCSDTGSESDESVTPGPGAYLPAAALHGGPAFSFARSEGAPVGDGAPGPGAYHSEALPTGGPSFRRALRICGSVDIRFYLVQTLGNIQL